MLTEQQPPVLSGEEPQVPTEHQCPCPAEPSDESAVRPWVAWFAFVTLTAGVLGISTGLSVKGPKAVCDEVGLVLLTAAGLLAIPEVVPALARIGMVFRRTPVAVPLGIYAIPSIGGAIGAASALKHSGHLGSASFVALSIGVLAVGLALILFGQLVANVVILSSRFLTRLSRPSVRRDISLVTATGLLIVGSCLQWLAPFLPTR